MIQNVFFDCDSTLVSVEGVNELARMKNKLAEVERLTHQAMDGQIPLSQVFAKRLDIIRPSLSDMRALGQVYIQNLTPGSAEVIKKLQEQGKTVYIISGGYQTALEILAEYLGIDQDKIFGVRLDFDEDGDYLGYDAGQPLTNNDGKKEIIGSLDLNLDQTAMIGDGANDLSVQEIVKAFIGFQGARENEFMRQNAKNFLPGNDLRSVFEVLEKF